MSDTPIIGKRRTAFGRKRPKQRADHNVRNTNTIPHIPSLAHHPTAQYIA